VRFLQIAAILTALIVGGGLPVRADERGTATGAITGDLTGLSDAEIDARVAFLVDRLEQGQRNARIWQYGFTTGWGLGIGLGTAQAIATDKSDTRVNGIVTAVKGAIGTTRLLLFPHPGRLGTDAVLAVPGDSRAARLERLALAEEQLDLTARYARRRTNWLPHLANVAINLAGGGVILGLGDAKDAAISTGVGILAGEILVWTQPWRSLADLEAYRRDFTSNGPHRPVVSWRIVPTLGGASLEVRF
jgi:hypothetical protein